MEKGFNDFQRYIKKDFSILVLTGDEYSIEEALELLKREFKDWQFENYFVGEEERIIKSVTSFGLFDKKKIIFIYYPENFTPAYRKELFTSIKKSENKDRKIVFITNKEGIFGDFKSFKFYGIYESEIENWIKDYVERRNCKITDDAISMLRLLFGNDRKEISSFLQPFLNSGKTIESEDLFRFNVSRESAVFEAIDYFFKKDAKRAIETFIISESENKFYALLSREINNIIDLKLKKNVDKFQKSFIIKKYEKRSENWEMEELKMVLKRLIELESKIKLGYKPFEMTIINILNLIKGGRYDR
uniref:Uncharacterized protein n=1 Tax=candidate division WOR-3 bacterium TaxID=2052148 RepID=A0A7C4UD66_UNCW3